MPLKTCKQDGRPGYKWGDKGACYTYTPGNKAAQSAAKQKAIKQGIAIEGPDKFKKTMAQRGIDILRAIAQKIFGKENNAQLPKND